MADVHNRVRLTLVRSCIGFKIYRHDEMPQPVESPADFARILGVTQGRITKTLFLVENANAGKRDVLICISSEARVDLKAAAKVINYGRLEVAKPELLAERLGYPRNGVSPLGAPETVPVLLDESLMRFETVLIGAGEAGIEIELSPTDLKGITGATVGNFTKRSG